MKEKHLSNRREKNPKIYQCCITFYGWNLEHVFLNIILPSLKVVRILNEHSVRNSLLQVLCGLTSVTYYTHRLLPNGITQAHKDQSVCL